MREWFNIFFGHVIVCIGFTGTIETRIDSIPVGRTGKGYKTYRCLILSDASGVSVTTQIARNPASINWKTIAVADTYPGEFQHRFKDFCIASVNLSMMVARDSIQLVSTVSRISRLRGTSLDPR